LGHEKFDKQVGRASTNKKNHVVEQDKKLWGFKKKWGENPPPKPKPETKPPLVT